MALTTRTCQVLDEQDDVGSVVGSSDADVLADVVRHALQTSLNQHTASPTDESVFIEQRPGRAVHLAAGGYGEPLQLGEGLLDPSRMCRTWSRALP